MSSSKIEFVLWHYSPSVAAAAISVVAFVALTIAHFFLRIRNETKYVNPLIVGGIFEILGYAARAWAHYADSSTTPYAMQSLLLLLGPILFAASVYMYLGRLISASGEAQLSLLPTSKITKTFVLGDVICFLVQSGGGGILSSAKSQSTMNLGNKVILVGLILQILFFLGFVTCASFFHARINKMAPRGGSTQTIRLLLVLYLLSALITIRNIYRVLEYAMGQDGYLTEHEWILYVFDAVPMAIVMALAFAWYWMPLSDLEDGEAYKLLDRRGATAV